MTQQLSLDLGIQEVASFNNYVETGNEEVMFNLSRLIEGVGERFIFLWGEQGSGVSHLLQSAVAEYAQKGFSLYLTMSEVMNYDVDALDGLEEAGLVCLDDIQLIMGQDNWQEALFHLFNRIRETGGCLLVGADFNPFAEKTELQDLASRLTWGLTLKVASLSDETKVKVLIDRAGDLGFIISETVAKFIVQRSSNSIGAIMNVLHAMAEQSLARQRKITVPFVKEVMDW
jgi:DnaA-homolog protein